MKKAIELSTLPTPDNITAMYDCDFSLFIPLVEQMNEMGAPVTLYDLMELIEGKLSGKIVSGTQDPHLKYTFLCHKVSEDVKQMQSDFK